MTRAPAGKVRQHVSLAPHVRETLHRLSEAALCYHGYMTESVETLPAYERDIIEELREASLQDLKDAAIAHGNDVVE